MEFPGLYDIIKYIEYGTNLHIGIIFLGNFKNKKCILPHEHIIHSGSACKHFKVGYKEFRRCFMCRTLAINKALTTRKPFGGLCINKVYEYIRPVVIENKVVCIIHIGNILTPEGQEKIKHKFPEKNIPFNTMEKNFDFDKCDEAGALIESYIHILFEKYPSEQTSINPIVENIKSYIHENLESELSIKSIAELFHYNKVYLGKLFKKETGITIKEYINKSRVNFAKELLKSGDSIIHISHKVGFNNVTYFNRIFKEHENLTPSEFKKSNNNPTR